MRVRVDRTNFEEVAGLRARQRVEAACQIVRDSILPRGLADSYVVRVGDDPAGYGGVWNEHFPGRVMEFYLVQELRRVCRDHDLIPVEELTNCGRGTSPTQRAATR